VGVPVDAALRLMAGLLEYPTVDLDGRARECLGLLAQAGSPAVAPLERFCRAAEASSPARMEELYTRTFDLQPVCSPYLGYHLFGESYKRGLFMARLKEGYRERGFDAGRELPDHAAVVLRFLAGAGEDEFGRVLRVEGLVPALAKMALALGDRSDNPYSEVIEALSLLLGGEDKTGVDDA
jgi:nitrate reductase molybdenum cofactor assembly chaperone NarJ/NarW